MIKPLHTDRWSNETIQTQLRGPYRNEPIYRKIEEELRKRGIVRGWKQCRDKLKTLQAPHIPSPGRSWRCCHSEPPLLSHSRMRSHSPGHDARTPASFPRFYFPLIASHFRIFFAISPWKASRLLIMALFSSQFSLPKRSTGITQVSTTDLEESGLRSPWNAPMLPYAKKALLAFLMFSVMARVASKSLCHQKPRHFPAFPVGRVSPPTAHG